MFLLASIPFMTFLYSPFWYFCVCLFLYPTLEDKYFSEVPRSLSSLSPPCRCASCLSSLPSELYLSRRQRHTSSSLVPALSYLWACSTSWLDVLFLVANISGNRCFHIGLCLSYKLPISENSFRGPHI